MSLIKQFPVFRKTVVYCCSGPSSPTLLRTRTLRLLDSEDEGISILLNVENYSANDRTPHVKRLDSIRLYLRHRKNGEFPLHWTHKETVPPLQCDLYNWCGVLMSQKEKVRAVKFPPRSDPLLPKHNSSHKKGKHLALQGKPSSILKYFDRMGFSGTSNTEITSKVTISKSISPSKHSGNYMYHLLQYKINTAFCSHTFSTGCGHVSGSCERGNELSFCVRYGDFLNWLRNVSFLRTLLHILSKVVN
jgi:hypothetical protein